MGLPRECFIQTSEIEREEEGEMEEREEDMRNSHKKKLVGITIFLNCLVLGYCYLISNDGSTITREWAASANFILGSIVYYILLGWIDYCKPEEKNLGYVALLSSGMCFIPYFHAHLRKSEIM